MHACLDMLPWAKMIVHELSTAKTYPQQCNSYHMKAISTATHA